MADMRAVVGAAVVRMAVVGRGWQDHDEASYDTDSMGFQVISGLRLKAPTCSSKILKLKARRRFQGIVGSRCPPKAEFKIIKPDELTGLHASIY